MEKSETYMSLGSACQTSIQLQENNMRDIGYCFDWLWNKEAGLINIIDILEDNFEKLLNHKNYYKCKRFKIMNKYYENIGFVHNNVLCNDGWEAFQRRIERTKEVLKSNNKIYFIYFRDQEVPIDKNYKKINRKVINHKEQIRLFKEETIIFRNKLNILYPKLDYHLRAFYRVKRHDIKNINEIIKTYNEDKITYNIVIGKNKKVWKKSLMSNKYIKQNPFV